MGDYDDLASTSERLILANPALHEATRTTLEEVYTRNTELFAKEIAFMKGRLIGLVEGNHYGQYPSGITTTQKLCELMGTKYLGVMTFTRLSFWKKKTNKRASIDIYAHHGKGAARLIGSSLNTVETFGDQAQCDISIMGHDHKKATGFKPVMKLQDGKGGLRVVQRKRLICRSGSFLRGLVDGEPSYIADGAHGPTDLGVTKIELTPRRTSADSIEIDIHASI